MEDCNTERTSLKKGNLTRTNWDQTEVFQMFDTGALHVQSEPGRTTILDGSVIERSNRFLCLRARQM